MGQERGRTRAAPKSARPAGAAAARRRPAVREPRLTRVRSRGVVAATTGFLGISSTRRAAILAIVVCAIALTVAVPLRNYVAQRQELAAVTQQQHDLAAQVDALGKEQARLSDPAEIAALARGRLGYAMPGEVPYVVQQPTAPTTGLGSAAAADGTPWFRTVWREVSAP